MVVRSFPADVSQMDIAREYLEAELEAAECPMKVAMQISVAFEEIFVNVAHYAYPDKKGDVEVSVETSERRVLVRFVDEGIPFDPLAKADPDTSLSAEERDIGGLGIYMVKKTMDEVTYEYKDKKNILTLEKSF